MTEYFVPKYGISVPMKRADFWGDFYDFLAVDNRVVMGAVPCVWINGKEKRPPMYHIYPGLSPRMLIRGRDKFVLRVARAECLQINMDLMGQYPKALKRLDRAKGLKEQGKITEQEYEIMRDEVRSLAWYIKARSHFKDPLYNCFAALNPVGDFRTWERKTGSKRRRFSRDNVIEVRNILIDIDADKKYYGLRNKAIRHITPIVKDIFGAFDRDLYAGDWKVICSSHCGNQVIISIKPLVVTNKNRRYFPHIIEGFLDILGYNFSSLKYHVSIDTGNFNLDRVFRIPDTWNPRKKCRAFPVTQDWTRNMDREIWAVIEKLALEYWARYEDTVYPHLKRQDKALKKDNEKLWRRLLAKQDKVREQIAREIWRDFTKN